MSYPRGVGVTGGILAAMTSRTPIDIVTGFLDSLARGDSAAGMIDVADQIAYTNVSMPTIRGRAKVKKIFTQFDASPASFNYRMVNVSADEESGVVLTERVDEIRLGRFILQFWVCGRFEIADAQITVWRDYFDYFDMTKALLKGLLGVVVPAVVRPLPDEHTTRVLRATGPLA
jgi:limonene-1,2-epoxide hydrolase